MVISGRSVAQKKCKKWGWGVRGGGGGGGGAKITCCGKDRARDKPRQVEAGEGGGCVSGAWGGGVFLGISMPSIAHGSVTFRARARKRCWREGWCACEEEK